MKGTKEVIDVLNEALANELVAINQYFMHARMSRRRGYTALADRLRADSMDQMTHAEALIDRILFLGGTPKMQPTKGPQIGDTIPEQLQNDLDLELDAVKQLNKAIAAARKKKDNASATLFTQILAHEEEHVSFLETQLRLIEDLGEAAYLQTLVRGPGAPAPGIGLLPPAAATNAPGAPAAGG